MAAYSASYSDASSSGLHNSGNITINKGSRDIPPFPFASSKNANEQGFFDSKLNQLAVVGALAGIALILVVAHG